MLLTDKWYLYIWFLARFFVFVFVVVFVFGKKTCWLKIKWVRKILKACFSFLKPQFCLFLFMKDLKTGSLFYTDFLCVDCFDLQISELFFFFFFWFPLSFCPPPIRKKLGCEPMKAICARCNRCYENFKFSSLCGKRTGFPLQACYVQSFMVLKTSASKIVFHVNCRKYFGLWMLYDKESVAIISIMWLHALWPLLICLLASVFHLTWRFESSYIYCNPFQVAMTSNINTYQTCSLW